MSTRDRNRKRYKKGMRMLIREVRAKVLSEHGVKLSDDECRRLVELSAKDVLRMVESGELSIKISRDAYGVEKVVSAGSAHG